ncbi:metallophosphoesterase family protein, partial [Candidatus Poribacteria bacterium]|nr:metallophosphoesterase family protein [Candidatus Poribacteria bacterium]
MKVALIGDIHANLPALEAVLVDAYKRGVEVIWNVGDLIGYGAFPDEVVGKLQNENVLSILGNYDIKVLKVKKKKDEWKSRIPPEKWFAFNWAYDNLSEANMEYLSSLHETVSLDVEGKKVLLVHGSPESNEESIGPDTPDERLMELSTRANANIIICGHSHKPFARKFNNVWFINTGSVGRPGDGDPRACYVIMQIRHRFFQLRYYRVEYDIDKAVSAIREKGLPGNFARMILLGRGLDDILASQKANEVKVSEPIMDEVFQDRVIKAAFRLAESCNYEAEHS